MNEKNYSAEITCKIYVPILFINTSSYILHLKYIGKNKDHICI